MAEERKAEEPGGSGIDDSDDEGSQEETLPEGELLGHSGETIGTGVTNNKDFRLLTAWIRAALNGRGNMPVRTIRHGPETPTQQLQRLLQAEIRMVRARVALHGGDHKEQLDSMLLHYLNHCDVLPIPGGGQTTGE